MWRTGIHPDCLRRSVRLIVLGWCMVQSLCLPLSPHVATGAGEPGAHCGCSAQARAAGKCCCNAHAGGCCGLADAEPIAAAGPVEELCRSPEPLVPEPTASCCSKTDGSAKVCTNEAAAKCRSFPGWNSCGCGHGRETLGLLSADQRLLTTSELIHSPAGLSFRLGDVAPLTAAERAAPLTPPPELCG